jgi:hypothetical protein
MYSQIHSSTSYDDRGISNTVDVKVFRELHYTLDITCINCSSYLWNE